MFRFEGIQSGVQPTSSQPLRHSASSAGPELPPLRPQDAPSDNPSPLPSGLGFSRADSEGASSAAPLRMLTHSDLVPAGFKS